MTTRRKQTETGSGKKAAQPGQVTSRATPSLGKIADEIARRPKTGKKADKKFFDALSGH